MTARWIRDEPRSDGLRNLYRVAIRGQPYLGTAEEHHAKVVAADSLTAMQLTLEALKLDPAGLEGIVVTLICKGSKLEDGKVFDRSHRCRGYGDRGGWMPDSPRPRSP